MGLASAALSQVLSYRIKALGGLELCAGRGVGWDFFWATFFYWDWISLWTMCVLHLSFCDRRSVFLPCLVIIGVGQGILGHRLSPSIVGGSAGPLLFVYWLLEMEVKIRVVS